MPSEKSSEARQGEYEVSQLTFFLWEMFKQFWPYKWKKVPISPIWDEAINAYTHQTVNLVLNRLENSGRDWPPGLPELKRMLMEAEAELKRRADLQNHKLKLPPAPEWLEHRARVSEMHLSGAYLERNDLRPCVHCAKRVKDHEAVRAESARGRAPRYHAKCRGRDSFFSPAPSAESGEEGLVKPRTPEEHAEALEEATTEANRPVRTQSYCPHDGTECMHGCGAAQMCARLAGGQRSGQPSHGFPIEGQKVPFVEAA